ncbi:U-scoloptoxin(19)-Sm1a [Phlebotomus argentipes]|uniref:U-scoloptoxin(19)-Sm1a n=1 Tax=Phlebotomus argentipes TaxID=94469 RepID=UPI002892D777|nr:U-scoloptoxin(19)-Sm1a [Phlebotomus argentipes]
MLKVVRIAVIATVCVALVAAYPQIDNNETLDEGDIRVWEIERECAMVGGLCVHKDDCDHVTSTAGLCPSNKAMGVECCYKLKSRLTSCVNQLGVCMDRCHPRIQTPATDCPGQVCCILV